MNLHIAFPLLVLAFICTLVLSSKDAVPDRAYTFDKVVATGSVISISVIVVAAVASMSTVPH